MIHQRNPLLISWDEESGCFMVSDFYRHFKPILSAESLSDFIKEYSTHSPEITDWVQKKGITVSARREDELFAIEDWLAKYVEPPKAVEPKTPISGISLDDLLK